MVNINSKFFSTKRYDGEHPPSLTNPEPARPKPVTSALTTAMPGTAVQVRKYGEGEWRTLSTIKTSEGNNEQRWDKARVAMIRWQQRWIDAHDYDWRVIEVE
jgi:hypothetical protein